MIILRPKSSEPIFAKAEKNMVLLEYNCALFLQNTEMSFLVFGI